MSSRLVAFLTVLVVTVLRGLAFADDPVDAVPAPDPVLEAPEAEGGGGTWEAFSDKGRLFAPLLADPREAQVECAFMGVRGEKGNWKLGLGGDLGLLHLETPDEGTKLSVTVRGLIAARFQLFSGSFDLLDTDFSGGIAAGYRWGENIFEAFLYHQSSHLGDEIMEEEERERISFSHETVRVLWSRPFGSLRLYAGPGVHLRAKPKALEGEIGLQAGFEYKFEAVAQHCFAAMDLQSRGENDRDLDVSVLVGIDLGDSRKVLKPQRLYIGFFHGHSTMGQYHDERETMLGVGIGWNL
jgi:Protein of unknown function (DUF1207)